MTACAWFVRGQHHAALAGVAIAAAKKADRNIVPYVATDDAAVTVPGARMVRFAPGLPLMVANVQAQLEVLWMHRTPVWFLDTDVLLLKPLPELWEEQIAVTWRDNLGGKLKDADNQTVADIMPYNFGVLGVHPGPRVMEAFIWMRERVRQMAPNLRDWYGNQVALASLAGPRPDSGERVDERRIPWALTDPWPTVKVRKLPCETWNYTPADAEEDISARGALHFKGHSRPLMALYADRLGLEWPVQAAA
jgi:hypothetical protein